MKKAIKVLGIPIDLGQSRRGVDMGPFAVRYAGLRETIESLGYTIQDEGNVLVPVRENLQDQTNQSYLPAIVEVMNPVYRWARRTLQEQKSPIFIGGDHSIIIGTAGVLPMMILHVALFTSMPMVMLIHPKPLLAVIFMGCH